MISETSKKKKIHKTCQFLSPGRHTMHCNVCLANKQKALKNDVIYEWWKKLSKTDWPYVQKEISTNWKQSYCTERENDRDSMTELSEIKKSKKNYEIKTRKMQKERFMSLCGTIQQLNDMTLFFNIKLISLNNYFSVRHNSVCLYFFL